jgi:hypothetical protein
MVSVFASSAVDRGFETRSGQTTDYEVGICCFSTKQTAIMIMFPSGVTSPPTTTDAVFTDEERRTKVMVVCKKEVLED